jgi:hypothetical protein
MAEEIKPANSMAPFCVLFLSGFTDTWIYYISQKYPTLVHLSFSRYHENGWITNYSGSINLTVLDSFFITVEDV